MIVKVLRRIVSNTQPIPRADEDRHSNDGQHDDAHEHSDDDDGHDVDSTPDTAPRADDAEDAEYYLEPWVDWVKRATRAAEAAMEKLRITDRVSNVRLRRWHWIRKLANTSEHEWTRQVFQWTPERDPVHTAKRR
eukprot:8215774-Pyramimonas_sp.AAC.1